MLKMHLGICLGLETAAAVDGIKGQYGDVASSQH